MIRILHTIPALDGGGADRILYDYTIRMADECQFDFIVHSDNKGILEQDLISRGCHIFHVPALHKNKKAYKKQIKQIIKNGDYDIIHVSQGYRGLYYLYYAKKYGIKVRIAHSHMAYIPESLKERCIRTVATLGVKHYATDLFACGNDAAKWMWGKKTFELGKVYIMKNAIDTEHFEFSVEKRNKLRKELNIEDKLVIGNVARFSYQKNHEFLIKIFAEVKKQREDAVLMLVGRGELEEIVKKQVEELGLNDSVIFMGIRRDVPDLLNAMDLLLLPSRYEGLPIVLIEAQVNGLACFASLDGVTAEANVVNHIVYIPLSHKPDVWAQTILSNDLSRFSNPIEQIIKSGYDIDSAAANIEDKYKLLSSGK